MSVSARGVPACGRLTLSAPGWRNRGGRSCRARAHAAGRARHPGDRRVPDPASSRGPFEPSRGGPSWKQAHATQYRAEHSRSLVEAQHIRFDGNKSLDGDEKDGAFVQVFGHLLDERPEKHYGGEDAPGGNARRRGKVGTRRRRGPAEGRILTTYPMTRGEPEGLGIRA